MTGRLVLDCSALLPGPMTGKLLRDSGARVIKIENPDAPDRARTFEGGYLYEHVNRGKELLWLNLTKDEDRAQLAELVRQADGLIEGFRPSAKRKLGLDFDTLHKINPRLCVASIVGYPPEGPLKDRAGHDYNFQAVTGLLSLSGGVPGLPLADLFTAYDAAIRLLAAMDRATRTGVGECSVVAMSEALRRIQEGHVEAYRATGREPVFGTTLMTGRYPCYHLYPHKPSGRVLAVGAIEPKFWERFCAVIGAPELLPHGYADGAKAQEAFRLVESKLNARPFDEWVVVFKKEDCCVDPVLTYPEVYGGPGGLQS